MSLTQRIALTRAAALGLVGLAACVAVATLPGRANAASAYRYWAYYVAHGGSWQYSQRGPATEYPVDGEVQGWRFAVQADAANGLLPRAAPDFATLCAAMPAKTGEQRVGVVIDFGLPADSPAHESPPAGVVPGCVYLPDGGTGADVVEAAATVRLGTGSDAGLVCGIDGYPKTECATAVAIHPPAAPASTPAIPRVVPSTHATATPRAPSAALASIARLSSAAAPSPVASASAAPPASAPAPTAVPSSAEPAAPAQPSSASASGVSLAALRSSTRHRGGVPAATIGGIALIAILGGAALWRTRARGR